MEPSTKPIWKSLTFWFNLLSLAAVLLTDAANSDLFKAWPHATEQLLGVVAVINIVLRFKTKLGVTINALLLGTLLLFAPRPAMATDVPIATYQVSWSFHSNEDTYGLAAVKQKYFSFTKPRDGWSVGGQYGPVIGQNLTKAAPAMGYQAMLALKYEPEPYYLYAGLQALGLVEQGRQGFSAKAGATIGFGYRF